MVQRDGAELRFMWGRWRREKASGGARRVPADFCCSSQDSVDRSGAELQMNLRGKQTHGGGGGGGAPRSSFIIPPRVSGERSRVGEGAADKFQMSCAGEERGAHPSRPALG